MGHEELPEVSIEELLRRARAGDEGARAELFKRCRPRIGQWAARDLAHVPPGLARPSDITQDTAELAYRHLSSFNGTTEAEWFAWLHRIFRNQAAQSVRNERRKKRSAPSTVPLDSPEAAVAATRQKSPSQVASVQEEWRLLLAHLYRLPDDQRDAIWLCHLKELPVAEAARRLGRTEPSVAGLLQRGLKALRARMAESLGAETGESPSLTATVNDAAAALLTYLRRRDAGEKVEPAAFIAENPDCADELRAMLHWIERLQALRPATPQS
ncbi:sigma-70 family RNA polymerase sigma factor [Archangium violaceum]|uniref:sigma-70 family RNA polymerase sigma factor n=1 Tax=Archangium violaceum TaxID=83451 RepID=UPI00193B0FA9|nr:sigma-70 family RNA polymerase sigma factor [Archangium violaceum]QRK06581.1 sigma-70 family RNA polymerase sigma factor [Archangium violaceum]